MLRGAAGVYLIVAGAFTSVPAAMMSGSPLATAGFHETFDGVVVPTRRKVFLRRRDNGPLTAVTLTWVDIETVRAVSRT